jgi:hypothetical protein
MSADRQWISESGGEIDREELDDRKMSKQASGRRVGIDGILAQSDGIISSAASDPKTLIKSARMTS